MRRTGDNVKLKHTALIDTVLHTSNVRGIEFRVVLKVKPIDYPFVAAGGASPPPLIAGIKFLAIPVKQSLQYRARDEVRLEIRLSIMWNLLKLRFVIAFSSGYRASCSVSLFRTATALWIIPANVQNWTNFLREEGNGEEKRELH